MIREIRDLRRQIWIFTSQKIFDKDFGDIADETEGFSVEEREWLAYMGSKVKRDDEGHYEIPLPRVETGELPKSRHLDEQRLESLRRRFKRDETYFHSYRDVIQSLKDDGYIERVPKSELSNPDA